jgi:AhpD family alkylhydroperoxidase
LPSIPASHLEQLRVLNNKNCQTKLKNRHLTLAGRNLTVSEHYHDAGDLHFLKEMGKLAPADFKAWLGLNNIVGSENGKILKKYRELIAIAVGCTTQCPYCIAVHSKAAKAAGATREEIAESAFVAAALRAGGAATHGAMALKFFDAE